MIYIPLQKFSEDFQTLFMCLQYGKFKSATHTGISDVPYLSAGLVARCDGTHALN